MPLRDLFKPRDDPEWKHPDPAVRAAALRRLDDSEQELIASLAQTDPAAQVRKAALRKIKDTERLSALLAAEADEGVREEAAAILVGRASSSEPSPAACEAALAALQDPRHVAAVAKAAALEAVRRQALARLGDAKLLAQVARDAADAATRLQALERVQDPALVGSVAVGSEHKDVALAALERIQEPEGWRPVAAKAHNKAAARRARALLQALAESASGATPQERRKRQLRLCETIESLARIHDWTRLESELADATAAWDEWKEGADPSIAERFDATRRLLDARVAAHEKEAADAEAKQTAWERGLEARTQLCERAEAAAASADAPPLDELRLEWNRLEAAPDDPAFSTLAQRFERALSTARAKHEADAAMQVLIPQAEALCVEAETAAEEADLREAFRGITSVERRWSELHGARPGSPELAERLRRASARLRLRQQQSKEERDKEARENAARLTALCEQIEALAAQESPNLQKADRAVREAREAEAKLGPLPAKNDRDTFLARLKAARQALYPKVQELKDNVDWQRWANVGVQEELCKRVLGLVAREDLEAVAAELRDIDAAWKKAGLVPKDKGEALWQRFKAVRDELRTRCDAYFAQKAAEHAENLKKKEALCERAEALSNSHEWVKTAQELQALQAEWKTLGPAPKSKQKAIWDRFHTACDAFFKRRKEDRVERREEWSKNRAKKEELCAAAEALAASTDWDKTSAELKKLQADWKTVGPVDRKHSEALWQRFRTACNGFFERFGKRHEIERAAQVETLERVCADMEALLPADGEAASGPPENLAQRVHEIQDAWRAGGKLPDAQMAPIAARFSVARTRVLAAFPEVFRGSDLDPDATRKKMEKLCTRVENLANELAPRRDQNVSSADLIAKLRDALASNTIGGKTAVEERWRAATEELEAAQAAWKRIGVIPSDETRSLTERFESACARLIAERPRPSSSSAPRPPRPAHPPRRESSRGR
jgi:hypothetical protein